ncbi:MAG: caspase family protein, partial [Candidatus Aminicenantaceae bacterium]
MKKNHTIFSIILLILFFILFSEGRGFQAAGKERRIALIIGNAHYKSSPLRNPVNDATDMARVLRELGFDVMLRIDAGQKEMENAIREFGNKLLRGGVGLFYFSGHGMQVRGVNYLIPVNEDIQAEDEVKYNAVDANLVLSKMESAKNAMNIMILDACRDNPFARSFRSSTRGLVQIDAPRGSLIVYATSPGKTAADGRGRNGIFTKYLLKMISEMNLEIRQLIQEVRKAVVDETRGNQTPW